MLKVIIEIHPFGIEVSKRTLLEGTIWNDTTGTLAVGNYKYAFSNSEKKIYNGEVKKYDRTKPVQNLVSIVLKDISKKEKKSHGRSGKV